MATSSAKIGQQSVSVHTYRTPRVRRKRQSTYSPFFTFALVLSIFCTIGFFSVLVLAMAGGYGL